MGGEPLSSPLNAAKLFAYRAPPGSSDGAHRAPNNSLADCRGSLCRGREEEEKIGEEGGKGREGRGGKEKGR